MPPKERWSDSLVEAVKGEVKLELDEIANRDGEESAVRKALHRISEFADDLTEESQLRTYVYVMAALIRFLRCGKGMTPGQIQTLVDRAYTILRLMRFKLDNPRISYLYGDLHMVTSQLRRSHGEHLKSQWQLLQAARLYRGKETRSSGIQAYNGAIRSLRLGNAHIAVEQFALAHAEAADDRGALRALLGKASALRLAGRIEDARLQLAEIKQRYPLSDAEALEWEWESAMAVAVGDDATESALAMTRKGRSHYLGDYVTEGILRAYATQGKDQLRKIPDPDYLKRSNTIEVENQSGIMHWITSLAKLYDAAYPLEYRLQVLERAFERIHDLESIELEMLAWLAATRWLARNRLADLAKVMLCEYRALSLRTSGGESSDVLGLASDLFGKDWAKVAA